MQITYKIWKLKKGYEKVLKEVICNFQKVLNESVNSLKKVLQVLGSVQKSPPAETPHHAETNQSTCNAHKLTGCNKTRAQNQRKLQNRPEKIKTCKFIV